jgi:hypothetical protein
VNLFIASELNWRRQGLKLRQETRFPDQASTRLVFDCQKPIELVLHVRHPFWATNGFELRINGEKQTEIGKPGSYAVVARNWKTGDTVELTMPFSLRTEAFQDNPNRFAFMDGPLVLCAQVDPKKPFPAVVAEPGVLLASLKPVPGRPNTFQGSPEVFRIPDDSTHEAVTLAPFYQAFDERYETYWDRFTPVQWVAKEQEYRKELAQQKELDARTVDLVTAGEEQDERDHNLKEQNSDTRDFNDRTFRFANTNGWFSWDLKVLPDQPQQLTVALGGGGRGGATFDIWVDDSKIATERITGFPRQPGGNTKTYSLSPELLKGKDKITVKVQAPADARGGSVYNVRILKPANENQSK